MQCIKTKLLIASIISLVLITSSDLTLKGIADDSKIEENICQDKCIACETQFENKINFSEIKKYILLGEKTILNNALKFSSAMLNTQYITKVIKPDYINISSNGHNITYNVKIDLSDDRNYEEQTPIGVQILDEDGKIISDEPLELVYDEDEHTAHLQSPTVTIHDEDVKWGKNYKVRTYSCDSVIEVETDNELRLYHSDSSEEKTIYSDFDNIFVEPDKNDVHTTSQTTLYSIPENTPVYNLDKTPVGLTVNGLFTGCIDSDYPGFIRIDADHYNYLVEDTNAIQRYTDGKLLPTGSISQLGGEKYLTMGCGPTCIEMIAKWEKGKEFSKDEYANNGIYADTLNSLLSTVGNAETVFAVREAKKSRIAARASGDITEITQINNGISNMDFKQVTANDIKTKIKETIDKNHRVIACINFDEAPGNYKVNLNVPQFYKNHRGFYAESLVYNSLRDIEVGEVQKLNINEIEGMDKMYTTSDFLIRILDADSGAFIINHDDYVYLKNKVINETNQINANIGKQHYILIVGYRETNEGTKFYVADPYYESSSKGYSDYGISYLYGLLEMDADVISESVLTSSDGLSYLTD